MKRPTAASLKKVTPENLTALGAERLANILVAAAANRPELKRRLRMELAAEQGADHLLKEIDKRLISLETSRSKVSWRQRSTFVRDVDALRVLIGQRLAGLDRAAALDRLWRFMDVAGRLAGRVRDREGELAAVFAAAAGHIGDLLEPAGDAAAPALVEAVVRDPAAWTSWLPVVLARTRSGLPRAALALLSLREGAVAGGMPALRQLADAAEDPDAYVATFSAEARRSPEVAAELARRLLASDRVEDAGAILRAAGAEAHALPAAAHRLPDPDFALETVWVEYLDRSGRQDEAQAIRWASFERTLSPERLKAFTRRLDDFDDVEAEQRAFRHAAAHRDLRQALRFLMGWPALPEAAALIEARGIGSGALLEAEAEAWAERLRARQPKAAGILFAIAAQGAARRRDRANADRLRYEAEVVASTEADVRSQPPR